MHKDAVVRQKKNMKVKINLNTSKNHIKIQMIAATGKKHLK